MKPIQSIRGALWAAVWCVSMTQIAMAAQVQFLADDIFIAEPSSAPLVVETDVYLRLIDGPASATVYGMLLELSPRDAGVRLIGTTVPSDAHPPLFPEATGDNLSNVRDGGYRMAAIGTNLTAGEGKDVPLVDNMGLFRLQLEVGANVVGTFSIIFGDDPQFTGLANSDLVIIPHVVPPPVTMASMTIVPEPSSVALLAAGAVLIFVGRRFRSSLKKS